MCIQVPAGPTRSSVRRSRPSRQARQGAPHRAGRARHGGAVQTTFQRLLRRRESRDLQAGVSPLRDFTYAAGSEGEAVLGGVKIHGHLPTASEPGANTRDQQPPAHICPPACQKPLSPLSAQVWPAGVARGPRRSWGCDAAGALLLRFARWRPQDRCSTACPSSRSRGGHRRLSRPRFSTRETALDPMPIS